MILGMRILHTTAAALVMPAPDVAAITRLPCVATGFESTLIRGNSFQDQSQTWMQLLNTKASLFIK